MPSKQTIYPFVVSMTGSEWDAIIDNLNGTERMPEPMLSRLMKKCLVVLNEEGSPRLFDPVAECVRFVSNATAIASVECPSARANESDITIFFLENRHIIATRYLDGSRADFLLSEADETPLEAIMQLAGEVSAPGICEEKFLSAENLLPQWFDENQPFFRFTIQLENVPNSQKVYAYFPRTSGGAWLIRSTSQGARQGDASAMLEKLKSYLEAELEPLKKI
jgi:hypothetical protein